MNNLLNVIVPDYLVKLSKILTLFLVSILLFACGGGSDNGDKDKKNTAFELTESDFEPLFITELTDQQFKQNLNLTSDFMADDEEFLNSVPDEVDCLFSKIGNITSSPNQDNEYEFSIPDTDVTACFDIENTQLQSVTASWYITNMTLQDSDGNAVTDKVISFKDGPDYKVLNSNYRIYIRIIGIDNSNPTVTFQSITLVTSNKSNDFNGPCQRYPIFTDCVSMDVTALGNIRGLSPEVVWKTVLRADNLNPVPGKKYYADGQMHFEINDWKGIMSYQADASEAPSYTASNSIQTVNGVFEDTSANTSKANGISSRSTRLSHSINYTDYIYTTVPKVKEILSKIKKQ